jgi:hypothetical protein
MKSKQKIEAKNGLVREGNETDPISLYFTWKGNFFQAKPAHPTDEPWLWPGLLFDEF